jgi:hypothetical protein
LPSALKRYTKEVGSIKSYIPEDFRYSARDILSDKDLEQMARREHNGENLENDIVTRLKKSSIADKFWSEFFVRTRDLLVACSDTIETSCLSFIIFDTPNEVSNINTCFSKTNTGNCVIDTICKTGENIGWGGKQICFWSMELEPSIPRPLARDKTSELHINFADSLICTATAIEQTGVKNLNNAVNMLRKCATSIQIVFDTEREVMKIRERIRSEREAQERQGTPRRRRNVDNLAEERAGIGARRGRF